MSKVATLIVRLGFSAGFLFIVSCGDSQPKPGPGPAKVSKNDKDASQNPPTKSSPPELKTTAEALVKEVSSNAIAAAAKYKGKTIELEGVVSQANRYAPTGIFTLFGGKDASGRKLVDCKPANPEDEKVWWLGQGQKVKIIGYAKSVTPMYIYLENCTIAEEGANPTPKMTAVQLSAEFAKDQFAAKKKYEFAPNPPDDPISSPKEVIVEGTVADLGKTVILAETDGVTVTCDMNQKALDTLKKGDKVTIKGYVDPFNMDKTTVKVNMAFVLKKG